MKRRGLASGSSGPALVQGVPVATLAANWTSHPNRTAVGGWFKELGQFSISTWTQKLLDGVAHEVAHMRT